MALSVLLSTGEEAWVDEEDAWVLGHLWSVQSGRGGKRYVSNKALGLMHRLINKTPPGVLTDHRDGDTFNNRRSNLRDATPVLNQRNRFTARADSTTGVLGVTRKGKGFRGCVKVRGKNVWGATKATLEEAQADRQSLVELHWSG